MAMAFKNIKGIINEMHASMVCGLEDVQAVSPAVHEWEEADSDCSGAWDALFSLRLDL